MIQAHELTKRYGDTTAVHSLSFTIAPGTVTGFLGPNGAGKSTTMRMIMGLDRPTSGTVTVNGKPYRQHRAPLREIGALLDAKAVHPGRSARSHLRTMAATHNITASRVSEVIEHLRVVIGHDDHLLRIGQVDPDDRVRLRHQPAQPAQPGVAVAVTPGHATTVGHERPPPAMGHQARSASGGRSYPGIDTQNVFLCRGAARLLAANRGSAWPRQMLRWGSRRPAPTVTSRRTIRSGGI
jgi:energy-coupling factor transporter ATP-binding protein EcfA2